MKKIVWILLVGVILVQMVVVGSVSAAKTVRLTFWLQDWPELVDSMVPWVEKFEAENPGVDIVPVPEPYGAMNEKMIPSIIAGTAPDMTFWYSMAFVPMKKDLVLLQITPGLFTKEEYEEKFNPAIGGVLGENGEFYSVPALCGPGHGITVNLDILNEVGVNPEELTSWDNIISAAKKMTIIENGKMKRSGFEVPPPNELGADWFLEHIRQLGGQFYDESTRTFDFTTPEAMAALTFGTDFQLKHHVMDIEFGEYMSNFAIGKVAMFKGGEYRIGAIIATYPEMRGKARWIVDPLIPGAKERIRSNWASAGFFLNKDLAGTPEKKEWAFRFYRTLADMEWVRLISQRYAGYMGVKEFYTSGAYLEYPDGSALTKDAVTEILPYIEFGKKAVYRCLIQPNLPNDIVMPAIEEVLLGTKTKEEALQSIEDQANRMEQRIVEQFGW